MAFAGSAPFHSAGAMMPSIAIGPAALRTLKTGAGPMARFAPPGAGFFGSAGSGLGGSYVHASTGSVGRSSSAYSPIFSNGIGWKPGSLAKT